MSSEEVAEYKPFVCALKSNQKTMRCDFCFKSLKQQSIECNYCHKYWYCSDFCHKSDSITHSFECDPSFDLIQMIAEMCSVPEVRDESDWSKFKDSDEFVTQTLLLLRILFKLKSDPNCATNPYLLGHGIHVNYDDIVIPVSRTMHRVWDQSPEICDSNKLDLIDDFDYNFGAWLSAVTRILESDYLKSKLGSVSKDILIKAFRIVIRYTLYVCDMSFLNEIGKAIYVEMCFTTHSCIPNCGPLFQDSNTLSLRLLADGITQFGQLKYDFQIEMTAYSAQELSDSLIMRNIECQCKKCLNTQQFGINYHKNVTNANLKYGNWPLLDYCMAMASPIEEALDYMDKTHDRKHPFITGLLLWKLRNEWNLFSSQEFKDTTREQLLETFNRLKYSLEITHGSQHIWYTKLKSIENSFKQLVQSVDGSSFGLNHIEETIDQIIAKSVIDQKIA